MNNRDWRRHYSDGGHPPACTCVACNEGSRVNTSTCVWHPNRETNLSCSRCNKPICNDCVVHSPVGMRCPECWYRRRGGSRRRAYGDKKVLKACIILLLVVLTPLALLIIASITGGARYDIRGFLASFRSSPVPVAFPVVADTPTPVRTSTPTVLPSPSPVPEALIRHLSEKRYMLKLINDERRKAGVPTVELGDNIAAQLHADASFTNCFSSHWGLNGLKPYMRYSLASGYQSNAENGSGSDYCIKAGEGYAANLPTQMEIEQIMNGLMSSSGHRRNILNKWHKKVNIGLAWDEYNFQAYQHFEGDYVEYDRLPAIENGQLFFSGKVKVGVQLKEDRDLGAQIYYDPPPRKLTRGQVARTYCYDGGLPVAALRPPTKPGSYYTEHTVSKTYFSCPDPYEVPKDAPAANSPDEATELWGEAYYSSKYQIEQEATVPWITALNWTAAGEVFSISANIQQVIDKHGDGVYTILVWGSIDGEDAIISQHSIFHGITPPDIRSLPLPTRTAVPTHTPAPTNTPIVVVTVRTDNSIATQAPLATATKTPDSTATPIPTATATSTPTPVPIGASRDNPIPFGQPGTTYDDFMVWVIDVQKDAHDIIVQSNENKSYYEEPLPGYVYILVRIRAMSMSANPQSLSNNRWSVVGPSQLEFGQCRTRGSGSYYSYEVPDEYDDGRLMFQGGEIEGNLCFTVKSSDIGSLIMFDNDGGNNRPWLYFALQ